MMFGFKRNEKKRKKRPAIVSVLRFIATALLVILSIPVFSVFICSHFIKTTVREIPLAGLSTPVKAVLISDLHGLEFGKDNARLLKKVAAQKPDVIFMIGDILPDSGDAEADIAWTADITARMQEIAQVYFSLGNHENTFIRHNGEGILAAVAETGAVVLDEAWGDYEINGNTVRLGGTTGHGYLFGRSREKFYASPEYAVLSALEESPYPAILLAHLPDTVALSDGKWRWHIDLVLSGHTHGGVIRVPGRGGLYAPMQGWWPRYDYGVIELNAEMTMVITSGFAGYGDRVPRIFNMPEICVLDLVPGE